MSDQARVAIRTVRFKSGGEVRLLRQPVVDLVRASAEKGLRVMLDAQDGTAAGYAIVLWDAEGGSQTAFWTGPGPTWPVTLAAMPDYVRNRLLLGIATQWAAEDTRAMLGYGDPPDDAS